MTADSMMEYPPKIQKEIDAFRALIGTEVDTGYIFSRIASKDSILHAAWAFGDDNPLWSDEEYAKNTRYGSIIAPPIFVYASYQSGGLGLPSFTGLHAGDEWIFYKPVKMNDIISGIHIPVEATPKAIRHAKRNIYQANMTRYTNQNGEVVAERILKEFRFLPEDVSMGHYMDIPRAKYTPEELQKIDDGYANEERRGAVPRYWEDVEIGEELPPIVKGPFTPRDSVAFYMAFGSRSHVSGRGFWRLKKTIPDRIEIDPETGLPEVRQMHHVKDSMAHARGIPFALEVGPHRIGNLMHIITNWIGDDGFMKRFDGQCRIPTYVGDTYWIYGKVVGKRMEQREAIVDLEVHAVNQRGQVVSPARAEVQLPSRG